MASGAGDVRGRPGWETFLFRLFMGTLGRPMPKFGLILSDQWRMFASLFMVVEGDTLRNCQRCRGDEDKRTRRPAAYVVTDGVGRESTWWAEDSKGKGYRLGRGEKKMKGNEKDGERSEEEKKGKEALAMQAFSTYLERMLRTRGGGKGGS